MKKFIWPPEIEVRHSADALPRRSDGPFGVLPSTAARLPTRTRSTTPTTRASAPQPARTSPTGKPRQGRTRPSPADVRGHALPVHRHRRRPDVKSVARDMERPYIRAPLGSTPERPALGGRPVLRRPQMLPWPQRLSQEDPRPAAPDTSPFSRRTGRVIRRTGWRLTSASGRRPAEAAAPTSWLVRRLCGSV